VSALLLNHWRFPDALVAMVEHHEDPLAAAGAHAPQASLLHLDCRLADELGAGVPAEEAPRRGMMELAGVLGLDDVTIVMCRDEAQVEIERTRAALDDLRAAAWVSCDRIAFVFGLDCAHPADGPGLMRSRGRRGFAMEIPATSAWGRVFCA
jgi:hypothetical protein